MCVWCIYVCVRRIMCDMMYVCMVLTQLCLCIYYDDVYTLFPLSSIQRFLHIIFLYIRIYIYVYIYVCVCVCNMMCATYNV